jgi:hypothetical protein
MKPSKPIVSNYLVESVEIFVNTTDADRLSHAVRAMFIEYLRNRYDSLPLDFHKSLDDVSNLFDLLDKIVQEQKTG